MLRPLQFQIRATAALAAVLFAGACEDATIPTAPTGDTAPLRGVIACRADVAAGAISCQGPTPDPAPGLALSSIVGGQGTYVQLTSGNVSYTSGIFEADVTVQNLIAQPMGTPDGTTVTGIRVFFHSGPTVTSGTGTVTVANADGTGTFTAANQPYFEYDEVLQTNEVSAAKTWQWNVLSTVGTFEFSVYVSTDIPVVSGAWDATADFGTVDFTVNDQGSAIIQFQFNVDNHMCGSAVVTGAGGGIEIWPISDQEFNIDHTDPSGHRYVLSGIFGPRGGQASGTWELTVSGNTCSGTWQGTPKVSAVSSLSGKIVFSIRVGFNNGGLSVWGLFAMAPDGSGVTPIGSDLSTGASMTPAASPDGQWVAYQDREVPYPGVALTSVKVARADGTDAYTLTGNPSGMPSWSRDGSRIALWAGEWLTVVDPDGSNMVQLVQCPSICEQAEPLLSPQAWSANSDSIYFSLIPDAYGIRPRVIYSVSVADGGVRRILDTNESNRSNTEGHWDASVAADGWILFTSDYWTGNNDVYMFDPTGPIYSLTGMSSASDYNPVWSPDGSRLAFVSDRDGSPKIYVLDGSGAQLLTAHPNADTDPHWVPGTLPAPYSSISSSPREGTIQGRIGRQGLWDRGW